MFNHVNVQNQNNTSNNIVGASDGYGQNFACLSFDYTAAHDNDTVYFAHCYPYTYTDVC